jgi:hypothetical protein
MSEDMDIQVDRQEESHKKDEKDNPLSTFLWSKEVRDGSSMENAKVSTEIRLKPTLEIDYTKKRLTRSTSSGLLSNIEFRQKEGTKYENTDEMISEEDIEYTIENFDKSDNLDGYSTNVLTEDALDNIGENNFVIVVSKKTDKKFLCRVDYVVRLSFEDALYESKSVTKRFEDINNAENFAEEIRSDIHPSLKRWASCFTSRTIVTTLFTNSITTTTVSRTG